MKSKLLSVFIAATILMAEPVFAQKKFELADVGKMTGIADPQISPDSKSVMVILSKADYQLNRFNTELVLIDIASGTQRALTQERNTVSQPRWSPDGSYVTFLSRAGKETPLQLFLLSMSGGEAKQLTSGTAGVQHYAWCPTGDKIAFASPDEVKNKTALEKGFSDFEIRDNDMFISSMPKTSHIHLVNINTGEQKKLTAGDWSLPVSIPPGPPSSSLSWSPDGKRILFTKVPSPYSGEGQFRTIQQLNTEDNSITPFTRRAKFESNPSFSPDGNSVLYVYKKGAVNENINEIWVAPSSGGEGKSISGKLNRDVFRPIWMPDGKRMLVGGHDDNKTSFWLLGVDGSATKLDLGNIAPTWSFNTDATVGKDGSIVFTGSEPMRPTELYYLSSPGATPKRLTDLNKFVSEMSLGKTETIRWETDGWKHNGILTYPVNYKAGEKYPLVLVIHGGPNSASVEQFARFPQLLSNEGYFVFEPNYRGSDNLGSEYKLAIVKDAGAGPGRDVMAGLDKLKKTGMIDTGRIGVSGWSYGGFMTVWLTGHYGGWKAAVAGAAVTDWVDQYNLSDGNATRGAALGGSPWVGDNMKFYTAQSPITMAKNIKAPTLILSNTGDPRVTITQSYKLYHALKDNNTVTKFIGWPIAAHNASDPITQMERDRLWIEWMNKYLK